MQVAPGVEASRHVSEKGAYGTQEQATKSVNRRFTLIPVLQGRRSVVCHSVSIAPCILTLVSLQHWPVSPLQLRNVPLPQCSSLTGCDSNSCFLLFMFAFHCTLSSCSSFNTGSMCSSAVALCVQCNELNLQQCYVM